MLLVHQEVQEVVEIIIHLIYQEEREINLRLVLLKEMMEQMEIQAQHIILVVVVELELQAVEGAVVVVMVVQVLILQTDL
jgi:hypothetical protein